MKKRVNIHDFQDFNKLVHEANDRNADVKTMSASDFFLWEDHSSSAKI